MQPFRLGLATGDEVQRSPTRNPGGMDQGFSQSAQQGFRGSQGFPQSPPTLSPRPLMMGGVGSSSFVMSPGREIPLVRDYVPPSAYPGGYREVQPTRMFQVDHENSRISEIPCRGGTLERQNSADELRGRQTDTEEESSDDYKGKSLDKKNVKYILDPGLRTRRFKSRSAVMLRTARELAVQTAARITLNMEYRSATRTRIVRFPEGPEEVEASFEGAYGPDPLLTHTVKEGFRSIESKLERAHAASSSSVRSPDFQEPTLGLGMVGSAGFSSANRRMASPASCFICQQSSTTILERYGQIESQFLQCAVPHCMGRVHYDCIGMPQLGSNNALRGKWHCSIHIGMARAMIQPIGSGGRDDDTSQGLGGFVAPQNPSERFEMRGRSSVASASSRYATDDEDLYDGGSDPEWTPTGAFRLPGTQGRGRGRRGRPPLARQTVAGMHPPSRPVSRSGANAPRDY